MKNRVLRSLLLGAGIGGLLLATAPAQAVSLSWDDPKGDATDHGDLQNSAFDITAVKLSNDGGVVKFEMLVPEMVEGNPTASTGYTFRMKFMYADSEYRIQVNENLLGETTVNLGLVGTTTTVYACEKCEGTIDREKKTAFFSAPVASLESGFKAAGAPPLAGQEWTGLIAVGMRQAALPVPPGSTPSDGLRWENDLAPAPEGTTLKF